MADLTMAPTRGRNAWRFCCRMVGLHLMAMLPFHRVEAAVVSSPRIPGNTVLINPRIRPCLDSSESVDSPAQSRVGPLSLRIRSTRAQDLDQIATLLANHHARPASQPHQQRNWNESMNVLRHKVSFQKLLSQRFRAMSEGRRAVASIRSNGRKEDVDWLQQLWLQDAFRLHTERAASMANEQHLWKGHNFDMSPGDPRWLQHAMLTAEDTTTERVVGFCEVAMIGHTTKDGDPSSLSEHGVPTIANLVACVNHRRQGIASSLVNSATRLVRHHWDSSTASSGKSHKIALVVEKDNHGAISLYSKHNFQVKRRDGDKLSMTRELGRVTRTGTLEPSYLTREV